MAAKGNSSLTDTKGQIRKCKICRKTFSDIYAYTEHLESKDHVKGIMKQKYGEKYLEAKSKLNENIIQESFSFDEKPKSTPKMDQSKMSSSSDNDEDEDVYTCNECRKVCTGLLSYKLHLEGKKHKKMITKLKLVKQMKQQELIPDSDDEQKETSLLDKVLTKTRLASEDIECKICKKKCCGPESFKKHCKSFVHQKKMVVQNALQELESDSKVVSPENDQSFYGHCEICDKGFSGPLPYLQHMESVAHSKQEKQMQQMTQIQDLVISSKEDSNFKCKECGKLFSGPVPFQNHLKSSVHAKLKRKTTLLEGLEKAYPEMVKSSARRSSINDDSDEEFLGCEVCNTAFSGPETARDHFKSAKHKKAVTKKAQFQKFKKQQKEGKTQAKGSRYKDEVSDFEDEFEILSDE